MSAASTKFVSGRIAIIGAGKIGESIISLLLSSGTKEPGDIIASTRKKERGDYLTEKYGIRLTDNVTAAGMADTILLCVKPQIAEIVLREIAPALNGNVLLISVMAGITIHQIEEWTNRQSAVIRAMPNTPLRIGKGMTALAGGSLANETHINEAKALFHPTGRTLVMAEKYFDAVTGLSASGPAFIYIVIESLAEGGVKAGLPRDLATELAAQACLGAASMVLETGAHPALLKDEVTTPAGCTIDGILKLEEGGIRVTLIKTVMEAAIKAHELGKQTT